MELTIIEKLKIIMDRENVTVSGMARKMDKSPQNLTQQFKRGDFRISDIEKMAGLLGYDFKADFVKKEE